jgi:hypothetical protein
MKLKPWVAMSMVVALAACGAPVPSPTPVTGQPAPAAPDTADLAPGLDGMPQDGQVYPHGNPYRLLAVEELPIVAVSVDSETANLPRARLIDGNLSTQWLNGGYRNPTSWAAVTLAASAPLASISLKTGPTAPGASYDVQVSADGATWTTVLTDQTNATWNMETKALPAGTTGQHVRIFWRNSPTAPQPHFAIYELVVNGEAGSTPAASPVPTPTATAAPTAPPSPSGALVRVPVTGATAESSYNGLSPARAIDGDLSTQWANGGYRAAEAAIVFAFAETHDFGGVRLRTGALPEGITFKVDVSTDGVNWAPASGRLTIGTWNMESRPVQGTGKFLKLRFFNSATAPIARFSVYEFEAYATTGGAATPTPMPSSTATTAPTPTPGGSTAPYTQWYPDFLPLPPKGMTIEGTASTRRLRFDTAIANVGAGHVQVRNVKRDGQNVAVQDILDGANRVVYSRDASSFVYFDAHGHNHVDDIARYELRQGTAGGPLIKTAAKISFCVEDSYKHNPNTTETARYPDCLPDIMGMTRGYADLYTRDLPGQEFSVAGMAAGEYTIVIHADPNSRFMDGSRANNVAWLRFHMDPAAGTLRLLAASNW